MNFDTQEMTGPPPMSHWHSVLACLELSEQQVADVASGNALYLEQLGRARGEQDAARSALDAALGAAGRPPLARLGDGDDDDAAAAAAGIPTTVQVLDARALAADELLERLEGALKREHTAHSGIGCHLAGKILTAAQFGRMAVLSYPYLPNPRAVAAAAAALAAAGQLRLAKSDPRVGAVAGEGTGACCGPAGGVCGVRALEGGAARVL
jgi:hypothetical protein